MRRRAGSGVTFLVGVALIAASANAGPTASGGTFRMSLVEIDHIDPALAADRASWTLEYATGALLFNYPDAPAPKGSRLVPDVAAGFPRVSRDGTVLTFRLKKTYRLSNGRPVRAKNFVRAFIRARYWRTVSRAGAFSKDIRSVRAPGPYTLQIKTVRPAPDLLARLATPFYMAVPARLRIDPDGVGAPLHSAGPYYVRNWSRGRRLVLERNPYYRGPRPRHVDRIEVDLAVPDETTKQKIDRGEADTGEIPESTHAELSRQYGVRRRSPGRYFVNPESAIIYLALNQDRPLFRGNVALRRAVNFAVDRDALMSYHGAHWGTAHDQILPATIRGFTDVKLYPRRPDLARARELAQGHLRSGKARLWCSHRRPIAPLCQTVAWYLRAIGLDVQTSVSLGGGPWEPTTRGDAYDVLMWSRRTDYLDPYDMMRIVDGRTIGPKDNTNLSYFKDRRFDRKIAEANMLPGDRRYRAFGALDGEIMRVAAPVAVIGTPNDRHYVSARTGCYHYHPVYGFDLPAICLKR